MTPAATSSADTIVFNANRAQFNVAEESYHIAHIVVTRVREAQVANGTGDDAATPRAAATKIQMPMNTKSKEKRPAVSRRPFALSIVNLQL